jgi:hypothetical protein
MRVEGIINRRAFLECYRIVLVEVTDIANPPGQKWVAFVAKPKEGEYTDRICELYHDVRNLLVVGRVIAEDIHCA